MSKKIYWQAHRGGANEVPQNTIVSTMYGWGMDAIVEVDLRTTKDNVIICLHNNTLEETTNAPKGIASIDAKELNYNEIYKWDAGVKFDSKYIGSKVPKLTDLFELMKGNPNRELYLDLKDIDLTALGKLIDEYGVRDQCIFCHCDIENCIKIKSIVKGLRCMQWIGGSAKEIKEKFEVTKNSNYKGVNQIQLHLNVDDLNKEWIYQLDFEFIKYALKETKKANIDLELFPMEIKEDCIKEMLDIGIEWFCTDYPSDFKKIIDNYLIE